jgi:hypothetical protein
MGFSAVALVVGAILHFAVTTQGHGFNVSTVGTILMIAGAIGVVLSGIIFATTSRQAGGGRRTHDREVIDSEGRSTVLHEETR